MRFTFNTHVFTAKRTKVFAKARKAGRFKLLFFIFEENGKSKCDCVQPLRSYMFDISRRTQKTTNF